MTVERQSVGRARALRRNQTDVERTLWLALRDRRLCGAKFRRHVPIGPYIVDFLCAEQRLIVELDGGQHGTPSDAVRQTWLETQGYRVLRFWNNAVADNLPGVLSTVAGLA